MTLALEVRGLEKRFGRVTALDGISLRVPEGSVFGLLGPNGAGKTTLLSIVAGFLAPDAGSVEMLGIDARDTGRVRGRFSLLPQDANLQQAVPVLDQIAFFGRLGGLRRAEASAAARRVLEDVGLADVASRPARALSHGMRKRAALAQALLGDPELVFLDEPTAGLDPENARQTRDLVRAMAGRRTVVVSSHNLPEIQELCDRVAILHRGRVAESATLDELTSADLLLRIHLSRPLPAAARASLEALDIVDRVEEAGGAEAFNLHLRLGDPGKRDDAVKRVLHVLLEHDTVPRSLAQGATLEARFLEIVGGRFDGASGS